MPFHAASDPRLGLALQAVHANAGNLDCPRPGLAVCNMSSANFARVFHQALGQAPMQHLADWRMTLARDLLLAQETTLDEIATEVGYSSVSAFDTAFRATTENHHAATRNTHRPPRQPPTQPMESTPDQAATQCRDKLEARHSQTAL